MVWIYGGGLIAGAANDYNASKLVTQDDVIVVTFNYRLGAFGSFAQPAIDAEHHLVNNYGLMDQQFALLWGRKSRSQREG
jgi:para-nitrobenzyl esterase